MKSWAIIAHSNYFSVSDWTIFPSLFFINSYHYQIYRHLTSIVQITFGTGTAEGTVALFFFFFSKLRIPLFCQDRIGYGFQGNSILLIYVLNRASFLIGSEGWRCAVYMPRYQQYILEKNSNFMMLIEKAPLNSLCKTKWIKGVKLGLLSLTG